MNILQSQLNILSSSVGQCECAVCNPVPPTLHEEEESPFIVIIPSYKRQYFQTFTLGSIYKYLSIVSAHTVLYIIWVYTLVYNTTQCIKLECS